MFYGLHFIVLHCSLLFIVLRWFLMFSPTTANQRVEKSGLKVTNRFEVTGDTDGEKTDEK